jgi:hypothetical protein
MNKFPRGHSFHFTLKKINHLIKRINDLIHAPNYLTDGAFQLVIDLYVNRVQT